MKRVSKRLTELDSLKGILCIIITFFYHYNWLMTTDYPIKTAFTDCLYKKGYYAVVITNQSGIARGLFTEAELAKMNDRLMKETGVDAVYYCPHHPEGKVKEYRKKCSCRKPEMGLLKAAAKDLDIDMSKSWMVGDRAGDILAGEKAGVKTILLESGYGLRGLEKEVTPDYILNDLRDVMEVLI